MSYGKKTPWNATQSLKTLLKNDPWMAIGVMELLNKEQWKALESGKAFTRIQAKARHIACWRLGAKSRAEATATEAMIRLASRDFLKRYNPTRSYPRPYLHGVLYRFVLADLRLKANRIDPRMKTMEDATVEGRNAAPHTKTMLRDELAVVKTIVDNLPVLYRDTLRRAHPFLGQPETPYDGNLEAERTRYCRAIVMVQEAYRKLGN